MNVNSVGIPRPKCEDTLVPIWIGNSDLIEVRAGYCQCDQKKIAKCLQKLPKNDFTTKMI